MEISARCDYVKIQKNVEIYGILLYIYFRRNLMSQNSYEKIYEVVKQIPRGQVATYGQVAALAGNNRWARVVGYALHVNPDPEGIPCYRVVNKEGRLSDAFAFGGVNRQKLLLEAEGVRVVDNHVDMERYQWKKLTF